MGNFLGSAAGIIFLIAVFILGTVMVSEIGIINKRKLVITEFLYVFFSSIFIGFIFLAVSCWTSNLLHGRANITDFERIFSIGQRIDIPVYSSLISFLGGLFFGKTVLLSFVFSFIYMSVFVWIFYLLVKKTQSASAAKKAVLLLYSAPGYFTLYLPMDVLLSYKGKSMLLCITLFIVLIFFLAKSITSNVWIYKGCLFVNTVLNSYIMYSLMDVQQLSWDLRIFIISYIFILLILAIASDKLNLAKYLEINWIRYGLIFFACIIGNWLIYYLSHKYLMRQASPQTLFGLFKDAFIKSGDSPHYLNIAQNGYQISGDDAKLIVFFPLYPILIRIMHFIIKDYFAGGVLLSNLFFGIACCFLYRIIREDHANNRTFDAVLLLMLFPYGLFFVGVFTESLFFMLTAMCIFYARKRKWILTGILSFLCALARIQGVLIFAFLAYEYLVELGEGHKSMSFIERIRKIKPNVLMLLGAPAGLCVYLLLNKVLHGDWFAFLKFQAAPPWFQSTRWIGDNITQHFNMSKDYYGLTFIIYTVQIILFFTAMAAFLYAMRKKMRTSYILYGLIYTGVTFLSGWMISGARYMMSCLPLYFIFAEVKSEYARFMLLFTNGLLTVVYFIYFLNGNSIM